MVSYCSKTCQRAGWKDHKPHCRILCELSTNSKLDARWSDLDSILGTKSTYGQKIVLLAHYPQYNKLISALLSIGADPNATINTGDGGIVVFNATTSTRATKHYDALQAATSTNNNEAIAILIKAGAGCGRTLHALVRSSSINTTKTIVTALKRFVNAGTDINYPDDDGDSPLIFAIRSNTVDIAECLINLGANVNCADKDGITPLMWTVREIGDIKLLRLLLAKDVLLDVQDVDGNSALHYAAEVGNVAIVRELVRAGAQLDTANTDGETALILASLYNNDTVVKVLASVGSNMNQRRVDGESALDIAVAENNTDIVRELVHAGVDVFAVDEDGLTVFQTPPEIARILCRHAQQELQAKHRNVQEDLRAKHRNAQEELRAKHRNAQKNLQLQHEEEKATWKRKNITINTKHEAMVRSLKDDKRKNDITLGQFVLKYEALQSSHDDILVKVNGMLESMKGYECAICFDAEVNCTLNCGHQLCHVCANLCKECPMCRVPITHRIKVFRN